MSKDNKKHFLSIYKDHADELFRYALYKTGDRDQSLEIVQDVYTRFWVQIQNGQEYDNVRAFLYTATRNAITDWYRKKKSLSLDSLHEAGFDKEAPPDVDSLNKMEAERILTHVGKLEEKYREVIILRFVNDLSVTEIAKFLDEKENNISVRIHRAIEKLRKIYLRKK